jgi:hypothetical protein
MEDLLFFLDIAHGDSGAPLFSFVRGGEELVAVAPAGDRFRFVIDIPPPEMNPQPQHNKIPAGMETLTPFFKWVLVFSCSQMSCLTELIPLGSSCREPGFRTKRHGFCAGCRDYNRSTSNSWIMDEAASERIESKLGSDAEGKPQSSTNRGD